MQNWIKYINNPILLDKIDGYNYSAVPILVAGNENLLIVTKRNINGKSLPFIYEFDKEEFVVKSLSNQPLIDLGEIGSFDEDGVMPVCSIIKDKKIFLYYIGWNLSNSTPFRNSIGLAISNDNGKSFYKPFKGPILDRSIYDPCFVASCCVIEDGGVFKMWYLSCDSWFLENQKINHKYNIKYAYSNDGINWIREGRVAIDYSSPYEYAISVPRVLKEDHLYKMWFSFRGSKNIKTYRIGYAESIDGFEWQRKDSEVGIDISNIGWDSEMICYPFVYKHADNTYMLYNGNGYGKTGFGIAYLKK